MKGMGHEKRHQETTEDNLENNDGNVSSSSPTCTRQHEFLQLSGSQFLIEQSRVLLLVVLLKTVVQCYLKHSWHEFTKKENRK